MTAAVGFLRVAADERQQLFNWVEFEAFKIDPADPDLHAALGRALAATGKPSAAAAALEEALLFHPADETEIHRTLAGIYRTLGETKKAAAHAAATGRP